ncbi:ComEC/Rec2 family competence protein [Dokdonia sp.]|uniref:ComEC/Rec2 family competence protein n=1 Tax=Dokdonia sp. TaxID=2024995 RepID=UPI0032678704
MNHFNLLFGKATSAFILGIIVSTYISISFSLLISSIIILCIFLFTCHVLAQKKQQWSIPFGIGILLLFFNIGILNTSIRNPLLNLSHYTHKQDTNTHTFLFSIEGKLKPTTYHNKYVVILHQKDSIQTAGNVLLNIQKDSTMSSLEIGEWYYIRAPITNLPIPKNPYQFDYGQYLKRKQIYGQFFVDKQEILSSNQTSENMWVWSSRFRESVLSKLKREKFTPDQLVIIKALLLGQRQGIDKEISTQYANAGMMHILAVSGLHVGIILLLLRFITHPIAFRRIRWIRSGIIIGLLWFFAFITGLSPSVLRAVTMFSFLEVGDTLGGKRKTNDALLFSAFILLIINPSLLYEVGFQLSYTAVIAILWIQPWLYSFYTPKYYIPRKIWGIITVTIAAQIGVAPLSLFYFHQFPGLFLLSNSVVLPFLGILLSIGVLIICLSAFSILPDWLAIFYGKIIDTLNHFIQWIAIQEAFVITHISLTSLSMFMIYVILIASIALLKKYSYKKILTLFIIVLISISINNYNKYYGEESHLTIFHKNRQTLIGIYTTNEITVYTRDSTYQYKDDNRIEAYQNTFPLDNICVLPMQNYFSIKQKKLLVIDSLSIYTISGMQPDYVLLSQSPNIHLDHLISLYPNTTIIADGTNYKSDITRWKASCAQQKIPFHSTYEKGFFRIP